MADLIAPPSFGPGSQPFDEDGAKLEYMEMPSGMITFAVPELPEPEDASQCQAALDTLREVLDALQSYTVGQRHRTFDLTGLAKPDLAMINQALGEGEVSIICGNEFQSQESVLAGVWRVRRTDPQGSVIEDVIEVGSFPSSILSAVFVGAHEEIPIPEIFGENVFNAPPLLPELNEHISSSHTTDEPHVINLSLLPHTPEDLEFLNEVLGRGNLSILSRGYGNCRVMTTRTKNVWWVQFFNSQDTLILNSLEVTRIPSVACAAAEDIADSAERLEQILEIYQ